MSSSAKSEMTRKEKAFTLFKLATLKTADASQLQTSPLKFSYNSCLIADF
jgi:hypothetical protein